MREKASFQATFDGCAPFVVARLRRIALPSPATLRLTAHVRRIALPSRYARVLPSRYARVLAGPSVRAGARVRGATLPSSMTLLKREKPTCERERERKRGRRTACAREKSDRGGGEAEREGDCLLLKRVKPTCEREEGER